MVGIVLIILISVVIFGFLALEVFGLIRDIKKRKKNKKTDTHPYDDINCDNKEV